MPQLRGTIAARPGCGRSVFQPCRDLAQLSELQGRGAFFDTRMQGLDALEHLAHHRCPGRVGKAVHPVPLRQRRQPVFECVDRQLASVGGEVARHVVGGGRQVAAPFDLEMAGRRGVSALGVGSGGGFQVLPNADHRLLQSPDGLGCNGPRASLAEKSGLGGIILDYPA